MPAKTFRLAAELVESSRVPRSITATTPVLLRSLGYLLFKPPNTLPRGTGFQPA